MPKLIAGLAALIALAGGIIAQVDPVTTVTRAGIAFFVGYVLTMIWYVFFATQAKPIKLGGRHRSYSETTDADAVS